MVGNNEKMTEMSWWMGGDLYVLEGLDSKRCLEREGIPSKLTNEIVMLLKSYWWSPKSPWFDTWGQRESPLKSKIGDDSQTDHLNMVVMVV